MTHGGTGRAGWRSGRLAHGRWPRRDLVARIIADHTAILSLI
ncbi:hypothetical protein ACFWAY_20865 [Rhodococcus sp. NPDC059968]